jgi:hypothetical protein
MQQVLAVADSLKKNARDPQNARYVAHQIALLYQCVNAVKGELKGFRSRIESRFESVKAETEKADETFGALREENGNSETSRDGKPGLPRAGLLSDESASWTESVAGDVASMVRTFPPAATEKLRAMARAATGGG